MADLSYAGAGFKITGNHAAYGHADKCKQPNGCEEKPEARPDPVSADTPWDYQHEADDQNWQIGQPGNEFDETAHDERIAG